MQDNMTHMILRAMAWQRACGELRSILETYVLEEENHAAFSELVNKFMDDVQDNGYGIT